LWTLETEGSSEIIESCFSVDELVVQADGSSESTTVDLCDDGRNIAVTEGNKHRSYTPHHTMPNARRSILLAEQTKRRS
jgi:hypothetical protein